MVKYNRPPTMSSYIWGHHPGRFMRILRRILIVLAILVAIPLVAGLFVNGSYAVERNITIAKPKQQVFDYVKFIKNQAEYSKWEKMDPAMKKEYRGTDGQVGFVSAWT